MTASRTYVLLCALTLLGAVFLSGCIESMQQNGLEPAEDEDETTPEPTPPQDEDENGSDPAPPEDDDNGDDGDNGNGNGGDDNDTPTSPTANLVANQTSGTAPLKVTFTFEGSMPGDTLNWSFDPGDGSDPINGTELPTTHEHEYESAGNHTAVLSVTDGEETAQDQQTISVEEGAQPIVPDAVIFVEDDPIPMYQDETTMLPITVATGSVVQWQWVGSMGHSVTSDITTGGEFDSGVLPSGSTFTHTFEEPGVYYYFCTQHATEQHGILIVLPEPPV